MVSRTAAIIIELFQELVHNQEKIMSALSDGIAAVEASLTQLQTDNAKAFSDLQAAIAASGNDSADVTAAVAALGNINTALQSLDTAALAADPANAAPAPTPAPSGS